ncbi:MAG: [FeFe] hydrogenase H-cluster maturation GTPase HydF [Succiniclasticum sp.]|jgi:[FeFe] hydrogenase H-cluster maturation GTPase HydF
MSGNSGMNETPSSERVHIGLFGRRNAGKSSLINALTGQNLAIVSDTPGTTTDPVSKAMELLPLGPVLFIDTPGIDDEGTLGSLRVQRSYQTLNKTDIAVLVVEAASGLSPEDWALLDKIREKKLPALLVFTQADHLGDPAAWEERIPDLKRVKATNIPYCIVSSATGKNITDLKETLARLVPEKRAPYPLCADLVSPGDFAVLVIPIDKAAPKGRLILPEQQAIRDLLDAGATAIVTQDVKLEQTLKALGKDPRLVITDSQAFGMVNRIVPPRIPLTSFSILMARHKGNLAQAVEGVAFLKRLQDGDHVLISEGCTHHRQCGDIGTVKLPRWLAEFTGKRLELSWTSGTEFPLDLSPYRMVIHCGGCMLNEREMQYRYRWAGDQHIPITNYGITIAHCHGILKRSLELFPDILAKLDK